jgi:hypothetical protein
VSEVKETYGDGVKHVLSVPRWTHDFAGGRTRLDASSRPGRPIDPENAHGHRELLGSTPDIYQETLSRTPNIHHDTGHRILRKELGLAKLSFKWIPHSVIESHKQVDVRIAIEFLRLWEEPSPQKLANVFTGDESWLYLENHRRSMWLASGAPANKSQKEY